MKNEKEDWRLINLPYTSNNIFTRRKTLIQLEAVAAAIHRCEAVIENIQNPEAKQNNIELQQISEKSASHPLPARNHHLLHKLMEGETALTRYLDASNHDPELAFAYAKGEAVYLDQLRTSDILFPSVKAFFGKAMLPILLVILTAILGNWVGTTLQKAAFERNRKFEVNLERLREGQNISGNLVTSIRQIHSRIQRDEQRKELNWRPHLVLQQYRNDLEKIRNVAAGLDKNSNIGKTVLAADKALTDYIECLENGSVVTGTSTKLCSDEFKITPFVDLEDAFSTALVEFLK